MKHWIAVGIALGTVACGDGEETVPPPSESVTDVVGAEVETFLDSYRLAMETRDTTRLRAFYVDDGRFEWIEDGEVRYRSPEEIFDALAALPANGMIRTEYLDTQISTFGDAGARVSGGFHTVFGEGDSAFEFGGMMSLVLEEGPTGWQIVGGHTSTAR